MFKAAARVVKKVLRNPIVRAVVQIAAAALTATLTAGIGNVFIQGLVSGALNGLASAGVTAAAGGSLADALQAGAFAFAQLGAFRIVGAFTSGAHAIVQASVHGTVSGAINVARGGNFAQGFAGGFIGKVGSIATRGINNFAFRTAVAAGFGCAGAAASGGKCVNGAVSAAFAHINNEMKNLGQNSCPSGVASSCIPAGGPSDYSGDGWPLIAKAYLLGTLGIALGAVVWLASDRPGRMPTMKLLLGGSQSMFATVMILVTLIVTATAVGFGVWEKEGILKNGRKIFVELAPVDPRSLMRGDYMALRFKAPRLVRRQSSSVPIWAAASVDKDGVATIKSYAGNDAQSIVGDIALRIKVQSRQVIVGTNAFFFQEGHRARYANARYGEFRVGPHGNPILVGLADKERKRIN